jgi:hypothetical protein
MAQYYQPTPGEAAPQNSTMAIISLVAGIAGWVILPLIGAIVAVITGHMAKKEIRASGGRLTGDGMATVGLVLGYAQLVLTVCGICGFVAFFFLAAADTGFSSLIGMLAF